MTRLLVIANSHGGALKNGWEAMKAEYPDIETTFFVRAGRPFFQLEYDPQTTQFGIIHPERFEENVVSAVQDINGVLSVRLNDFDRVAMAGLHYGFRETMSIVAASHLDGLRAKDTGPMLSDAALTAFLSDIAGANLPHWAFGTEGRPPIDILATPRMAETVEDSTDDLRKHVNGRALIADPRGLGEALERLDRIYAGLLAAAGFGFVPQPVASISPSGFSKREYCDGWITYQGKTKRGFDASHMNPGYGKLCLTEYFETIANRSAWAEQSETKTER